jgi:hypothetical protein
MRMSSWDAASEGSPGSPALGPTRRVTAIVRQDWCSFGAHGMGFLDVLFFGALQVGVAHYFFQRIGHFGFCFTTEIRFFNFFSYNLNEVQMEVGCRVLFSQNRCRSKKFIEYYERLTGIMVGFE